MPEEPHDLERFVTAQAETFATALAELRAGRKRSHWMWFVFPQMRGLGRSPTAIFYGLVSLSEAQAYLAHPLLGQRLVECTRAVLATDEASLNAIFGSPDDIKFQSSMTLFAQASDRSPNDFSAALDRFCGSRPDQRTLDLVGK